MIRHIKILPDLEYCVEVYYDDRGQHTFLWVCIVWVYKGKTHLIHRREDNLTPWD